MKDTYDINLRFVKTNAAERPALYESDNRSGFINYGTDNKYGDYLYNIYTKCSTMQSIINSTLVYASSFDIRQGNIDSDTVERIILDYIIFGGFALQVNRFSDFASYKWIDFKNLRTNREKNRFWYSREWGKARQEVVNLTAYRADANDRSSIFYFSGLRNRDKNVYPTPGYSGCILDLETDIEISNFWNNSIQNNLCPSAIISFNNGIPDQETQREIEKQINAKFSGSNAASKTIISFNDSAETAPTIERLADDNFDQKYQALTSTIQQRIFTAFRMNPMLAGVNVQTGFSKEEFIQAYDLYYITVISEIQKTIKRQLEKVGIDIDFKKFEIYDDGGVGVTDTTEITD